MKIFLKADTGIRYDESIIIAYDAEKNHWKLALDQKTVLQLIRNDKFSLAQKIYNEFKDLQNGKFQKSVEFIYISPKCKEEQLQHGKFPLKEMKIGKFQNGCFLGVVIENEVYYFRPYAISEHGSRDDSRSSSVGGSRDYDALKNELELKIAQAETNLREEFKKTAKKLLEEFSAAIREDKKQNVKVGNIKVNQPLKEKKCKVGEKDKGSSYQNGKTKEWFPKSNSIGNASSMFQLGVSYFRGEGVDQDFGKAKEMFEEAASKHDHSPSMFNLGIMYKNGHGIVQSYEKAKEWFEKASQFGHIPSMFHVGVFYFYGEGVDQNYEKAKDWFEKASKENHAPSMYHLGLLYKEGHGVIKDFEKAKDWFEKASKLGDASSMHHLALLYKEKGKNQNYQKATEWFGKASKLGHAPSMYHLGLLYRNRGDFIKSDECFEKVIEMNDKDILYTLGLRFNNGDGMDQNYEKARKCYEKAVELGHSKAMFNLGVLYRKGQGVDKNEQKARELFRRASEISDVLAL